MKFSFILGFIYSTDAHSKVLAGRDTLYEFECKFDFKLYSPTDCYVGIGGVLFM